MKSRSPDAGQGELFAAGSSLPASFSFREEFMSAADEARVLDEIGRLPLQEAPYRQWTAKRRILSFGGSYDFTHSQLLPAAPIPPFLHPLRAQLARWVGLEAAAFEQANITEYRPGTQLGWHRDLPAFDVIAGASLAGHARMRFRPYPPAEEVARATHAIDLPPRSAYVMRDVARWQWQHAISPTRELRYSITFRTLRQPRNASAGT